MNRLVSVFLAAVICGSATGPAEGARHDDVEDRGDTLRVPGGERKLLRRTGVLALRTERGANRAAVRDQLLRRGGALEDFEVEKDAAVDLWILKAKAAKGLRDMVGPSSRARQVPKVAFCRPVFVDPASGLQLTPEGRIVVRLKNGIEPTNVFAGAEFRRVPHTREEYFVERASATAEEILAEANRYASNPGVEWAEPDWLMEIAKDFTPNDTLYTNQWHLHNTGQSGGTVDADVDAPEAWDVTRGSNTVVIAIIDDGVELAHPDLAPVIFTNTGETVNGLDDDGNGYVDDVNGWNFYDNNNDSNPIHPNDRHGVACAGIAAAAGNNGVGVAGVAHGCRLLPVKVMSGSWVDSAGMARAIRYAAGLDTNGIGAWRGADVLSMSWVTSYSLEISGALEDARTRGRRSKGCLLFCSTGNEASAYVQEGFGTSFLPAGTYFVQIEYYKDSEYSSIADRIWVSEVQLPDAAQTLERFDNPGLPAGWSAGGDVPFEIADDAAHQYGTGRYVARSGDIGDDQRSYLRSPNFVLVPGNPLTFLLWKSIEERHCGPIVPYPPLPACGDIAYVRFYNVDSDTWTNIHIPVESDHVHEYIEFPASHPATLAVGASTHFDYRSDYSQFGTGLVFVAPGGGGGGGIYTTDRTGTNGYNTASGTAGDYLGYFIGTSASTPLASGVAALLLSVHTNATAKMVEDLLIATCDPIGGENNYTNNWSYYHGYGRVNAGRALAQAGSLMDLVLTNPTVRTTRRYEAIHSITARDQFRVETPGDVELRAGGIIRLQTGFVARTGSTFHAVIDPDL